jgi:hypothetical protein
LRQVAQEFDLAERTTAACSIASTPYVTMSGSPKHRNRRKISRVRSIELSSRTSWPRGGTRFLRQARGPRQAVEIVDRQREIVHDMLAA